MPPKKKQGRDHQTSANKNQNQVTRATSSADTSVQDQPPQDSKTQPANKRERETIKFYLDNVPPNSMELTLTVRPKRVHGDCKAGGQTQSSKKLGRTMATIAWRTSAEPSTYWWQIIYVDAPNVALLGPFELKVPDDRKGDGVPTADDLYEAMKALLAEL